MASEPKMLADLRRIVERVDTTDGFDEGLIVDFIAEHGPALLARLEGQETAREMVAGELARQAPLIGTLEGARWNDKDDTLSLRITVERRGFVANVGGPVALMNLEEPARPAFTPEAT